MQVISELWQSTTAKLVWVESEVCKHKSTISFVYIKVYTFIDSEYWKTPELYGLAQTGYCESILVIKAESVVEDNAQPHKHCRGQFVDGRVFPNIMFMMSILN